jgi:hypothetical protein
LVAVRLCEVAEDGASRLVSWALLNLTHRSGHEQPEPLEPGHTYAVNLQLNAAAHRITPGRRWRVAVSPTYWPHAWPSPQPVRLTLTTGDACRLVLPIREPGGMDAVLEPFAEPEGAAPMEFDSLRPDSSTRSFHYDAGSGRLELVEHTDEGRNRIHANGILYDSTITNTYSIVEGQPLSARVRCDRAIEICREDWQTRVETTSVMSADANFFLLTNVLDAYEGSVRVFTKSWTRKIPRQGV